jgi:hypothetical protein
MVHQHVIKIWVENKCFSMRNFYLASPICIILQDDFTSNDLDEKSINQIYLLILIFFLHSTIIVIQCVEIESLSNEFVF